MKPVNAWALSYVDERAALKGRSNRSFMGLFRTRGQAKAVAAEMRAEFRPRETFVSRARVVFEPINRATKSKRTTVRGKRATQR